MTRRTFEQLLPEDLVEREPSTDRAADAYMDGCHVEPAWTVADIALYAAALKALGFSPEKIKAQIAKDCIGVVIGARSAA